MAESDGSDGGRGALLSALTTEHFVLQSAYSSTISEAAARSTLYVMALSSSLVAMGFFAQSQAGLVPFAASVLPVVFLLGVFTVVRLVDTGLESMHYETVISEIRAFYRTLGPDAERLFAAERGRWPEAKAPSLALGRVLAFLGTTASMIAVVNAAVAGAWTTLVVRAAAGLSLPGSIAAGAAVALAATLVFMAYQRWRFRLFDGVSPVNDAKPR